MNETHVTFDHKTFFMWLFVFGVVSLIIFIESIVISMAKKRGRSTFGWFILTLIISPFLCMLFLMALGETDDKRRERIIEEERLRSLYRS